jgi:adenylate kinase
LERRPEDTEAGVRKRLEWFQKEVQPVINYYEEAGCLIRINGEQSIENVFQDIIKSIQED